MLQVQVIGRLGRDCEVREYNGNQFVSFQVAVDKSYKDATGQKVKKTEWLDVVAKKTGVTAYLLKGQEVFIEGDVKAETYQSTKDNQLYPKLKVKAYKIQLIGSKNDETAPAGTVLPTPDTAPPAPAITVPVDPRQANLGGFAGGSLDDDLPF